MKQTVMALLLLLCLLVSGCGAAGTENQKQDAVFEDATQTVDGNRSGIAETLETVDASEQAKWNAFNGLVCTMTSEPVRSLFLVDDTTGVVYYVNQYKDWYIYRIKDGEVSLAVSMPAKELQTHDGILYFMLDDYGKYDLGDAHIGDIYSYTPETGEVAVVYTMEDDELLGHNLAAKEDGLYFCFARQSFLDNPPPDIHYFVEDYFLPYGSTTPERVYKKDTTRPGWREYALMGSFGDTLLRSSDEKGEVETITLPMSKPSHMCVVDDTLYCKHKGSGLIRKYDLLTEEEQVYDLNEAMLEGEQILYGFSATEQGKYIWVNGDRTLFRIDTETGEINTWFAPFYFANGSTSKYYNMNNTLYTDGTHLYTLASSDPKGFGSLAKIEFVEDKEKGEKIKITYLKDGVKLW